MYECKKCGVELDPKMNFCPLCGEKAEKEQTGSVNSVNANNQINKKNHTYDLTGLTEPQREKLFWELSGIILLTGMIVTSIIDFLTTKTLTWSKYTLAIGLYLFINISLLSFMKNKAVFMAFLSFVSTALLLLTIDYINNNMGWGLKLGVPLILSTYFAIGVFITTVKKTKQKGINLIAFFLLLSGVLCIIIETIVSLHLGAFKLIWSPILLVSVFSVAVILLFIHYRLKKVTDLKRFFHI
ncbi:MAG TPA: DUF6320 domain-containing protein [Prolixibacteraceae bacterium]|nr:DUF6320 domain-containing protein [Prolixibacteraceae bacterium]